MKDPYRLALPALILVVVLRMSIGWQFLYEGLWKIDTLSTPKPWTAAGYLKNSQGPMRGFFREMAGDPDELGWLDYDTVAARWDDWRQRFEAHYGLDEKQADSLRRLMDGSWSVVKNRKVYIEALDKLPSGVEDLNKASRVSTKVIWFDAKAKRLYVDAEMHLKPDEFAKLQSVVKGRDDDDARAYLRATQRIFDRQKKGMGFKEKLAGALKGDPELVGNDDWQRVGKLQQYREGLIRYENARAEADQDFEWDHLKHEWGKLQTLRSELTGPIKSLESELKEKAQSILTLNQLSRGGVPGRWTQLEVADQMTIIGLTILGALLLLGLASRLAAFCGAVMLFNFYMAMPPLPGLPPAPGPEHSYVINKNLIEVIALLGIAAMPTGRWFGLDAIIAKCCGGCCRRNESADEAAPEAAVPEPESAPSNESDNSSSEPAKTEDTES